MTSYRKPRPADYNWVTRRCWTRHYSRLYCSLLFDYLPNHLSITQPVHSVRCRKTEPILINGNFMISGSVSTSAVRGGLDCKLWQPWPELYQTGYGIQDGQSFHGDAILPGTLQMLVARVPTRPSLTEGSRSESEIYCPGVPTVRDGAVLESQRLGTAWFSKTGIFKVRYLTSQSRCHEGRP